YAVPRRYGIVARTAPHSTCGFQEARLSSCARGIRSSGVRSSEVAEGAGFGSAKKAPKALPRATRKIKSGTASRRPGREVNRSPRRGRGTLRPYEGPV